MHNLEFLRDHYYFMENMALLEVSPWKQAIKQKFLTPVSKILKARAKNPVALFQSRVMSVLPRLFLLRRTACVLWMLSLLQVICSCHSTIHRLDA